MITTYVYLSLVLAVQVMSKLCIGLSLRKQNSFSSRRDRGTMAKAMRNEEKTNEGGKKRSTLVLRLLFQSSRRRLNKHPSITFKQQIELPWGIVEDLENHKITKPGK